MTFHCLCTIQMHCRIERIRVEKTWNQKSLFLTPVSIHSCCIRLTQNVNLVYMPLNNILRSVPFSHQLFIDNFTLIRVTRLRSHLTAICLLFHYNLTNKRMSGVYCQSMWLSKKPHKDVSVNYYRQQNVHHMDSIVFFPGPAGEAIFIDPGAVDIWSIYRVEFPRCRSRRLTSDARVQANFSLSMHFDHTCRLRLAEPFRWPETSDFL